ncbi:MAG: chemotaxis protein CheD [Thermodesulfobacteriota bacterium]
MIIVESGQRAISTILGSCVAVCLWDRARMIGGMNHYLLPVWSGSAPGTPAFGNVAIPLLLDTMAALGCGAADLQAWICGGADITGDAGLFMVGRRNVEFAEGELSRTGIPVTGRDVGGVHGRKVFFCSRSGELTVARLGPAQAATSAPSLNPLKKG